MLGLTETGLRARISNNRLELTGAEAVDLFFLYPRLVDLEWTNGNIIGAYVNGLNLKFSIRD